MKCNKPKTLDGPGRLRRLFTIYDVDASALRALLQSDSKAEFSRTRCPDRRKDSGVMPR